MNRFSILFAAISLLFISSCIVPENPYTVVAPGTWRAVLRLEERDFKEVNPDEKVEEIAQSGMAEVTQGELPFEMEITVQNDTSYYIDIINGDERIRVNDVSFGLEKRGSSRDTFRIDFPIYETYITGYMQEGVMEGAWHVPAKGNYSIPFVAKYGDGYRFTELKKKPAVDLTGKWAVTFGLDSDEPYPAIGEFKQEGTKLTGTFRTETGDYRYLAGTIQANKKGYDKIYLSTFDGSHAFLFEAKTLNNNELIGTFKSGRHYQTTWSAKRDPNVTLPDPDTLTYLKEGFETLDFEFKNANGKIISPKNPEYAGKVVLIQIFGTWCPNCRDETEFLVNYLQEKNNPDLKVIGLGFERYRESDRANQALQTYRKQFGIDYELLHAGYANKKEAAEVLPALNHVLSYPTLIFMDKKGEIRRIHTGFNGPATSVFSEFSVDFNIFVDKLLAE